jgi:hypothetical protein
MIPDHQCSLDHWLRLFLGVQVARGLVQPTYLDARPDQTQPGESSEL